MMPGMRIPSDRPRLARALIAWSSLLLGTALLAACGHLQPSAPAPARAAPPADNAVAAGAVRALKLRFPALHPIAHASGRLQVDDADDLAVALAPAGAAPDIIVALLVSTGASDFRVVAVSRPVAPGCAGCVVSVAIARHLLSVQVAHGGDPDFERVSYQFGYRDNGDALRLIGVVATQPAQPDDPIAQAYTVSADLLAGTRTDAVETAPADPARRRELRSKTPVPPPIAFDAFAFGLGPLAAQTRKLPPSAFDPPEPLPPVAAALLRARFPALAVRSHTGGALRTEGGRDVAAVLAPAAGGAPVVAALLEQADGSMRLAAVSAPLARDCAGCDVQVEIARHALIVQVADVGGTLLQGYQFSVTGKDAAARAASPLRLVGVRTVTVDRSANGDVHRAITTANLATGDKLDVSEDIVQGTRKRAQRAGHVPLRPPIALAGFAFDPRTLDAETRREPGASASAP